MSGAGCGSVSQSLRRGLPVARLSTFSFSNVMLPVEACANESDELRPLDTRVLVIHQLVAMLTEPPHGPE
jgi:hypothetical protein